MARVGEQIYPILPKNLAIGAGSGILLAILFWFLINPFRFKRPPVTFFELIVTLAVIALCLVGGMSIFSQFDDLAEYQSTITVDIRDTAAEAAQPDSDSKKRLIDLAKIPHEILFKQYRIIEYGMHRNNLFGRDTFLELSKEEGIEHVQERLEIESAADGSNALKISFRHSSPKDCKEILEKLVESYFRSLERQNGSSVDEHEAYQQRAEENGDTAQEFGLPRQFQAKILEPASEAVFVGRRLTSTSPRMLGGIIGGLLGLIACLVWRASRDGNNNSAS